jgi:uncharacterized RDD family membrane protein YckC
VSPHANQSASRSQRARYALIDIVIFFIIWWGTVVYANVTPPVLAFMSVYTAQDYKDYIYAVSVMSVILFVYSVIMHWLSGGSVGKIMMGCRTCRNDGSKLSFGDAFFRALFWLGIALCILAPGPIVAAIFGSGSDFVAFGLLMCGLYFWIFALSTETDWFTQQETLPLLERFLGIKTVRIA